MKVVVFRCPRGNGCLAAFTEAGSAADARHFGRGAGLVDEDQLIGVEVELAVEPGLPRLADILAVLRGGVGGLFCT